jgi:hypothetical protein
MNICGVGCSKKLIISLYFNASQGVLYIDNIKLGKNLFDLGAHLDRVPRILLIRLKYKRNCNYFGDKFVSAITFYYLHIMRNRFHY